MKRGKQYDSLMPFSDCSSIKLAEGNTKVAIENMAVWVKKYQHHTSKLSVLFAKKGLKETCIDLHKFLFEHFQYKIDGYKQKLRSPACSWSTRQLGIDCKSYSVFASSVLLNLGVKHFLRRVKLSKNVGFSHVYVIVPKNQGNPKDLSAGYYVIDGTLKVNEEASFFIPDDLYMEADLPIYGLAGQTSSLLSSNTKGVNSSLGVPMPMAPNPLMNSLLSGAAQVVDLAVQGLIEQLAGCPDIEYSSTVVSSRLRTEFADVFKSKLSDLDDAISWNNRTRIQSLFNDLLKEMDLGIAHLRNEAAYLGGNECEAEVLATSLKYITEIKENVFEVFFNNFLNIFSRYKVDIYTKTATTTDRLMYFVVQNSSDPITADYRFIHLREEENKYGVDPVIPYGKNFTEWLLENKRFLERTYNDGREFEFEKEISILLKEVEVLRNTVHLGGEALYLLEKPFHREMYAVWLKYDDNYTEYIFSEAQSLKTANEMALKDFEERLKVEIEKDIQAKKISSFKKIMGFGSLAFASFLIVKK